jgi:hypothetical protein
VLITVLVIFSVMFYVIVLVLLIMVSKLASFLDSDNFLVKDRYWLFGFVDMLVKNRYRLALKK